MEVNVSCSKKRGEGAADIARAVHVREIMIDTILKSNYTPEVLQLWERRLAM
jgi:hypothetical protein